MTKIGYGRQSKNLLANKISLCISPFGEFFFSFILFYFFFIKTRLQAFVLDIVALCTNVMQEQPLGLRYQSVIQMIILRAMLRRSLRMRKKKRKKKEYIFIVRVIVSYDYNLSYDYLCENYRMIFASEKKHKTQNYD